MKKERIASQVTSVHNVVMLAGLLGVGLTGSIAVAPTTSDTMAQRTQAGQVASLGEQQPAAAAQPHAAPVALGPTMGTQFNFKAPNYFDQLRKNMNWEPIRY